MGFWKITLQGPIFVHFNQPSNLYEKTCTIFSNKNWKKVSANTKAPNFDFCYVGTGWLKANCNPTQLLITWCRFRVGLSGESGWERNCKKVILFCCWFNPQDLVFSPFSLFVLVILFNQKKTPTVFRRAAMLFLGQHLFFRRSVIYLSCLCVRVVLDAKDLLLVLACGLLDYWGSALQWVPPFHSTPHLLLHSPSLNKKSQQDLNH